MVKFLVAKLSDPISWINDNFRLLNTRRIVNKTKLLQPKMGFFLIKGFNLHKARFIIPYRSNIIHRNTLQSYCSNIGQTFILTIYQNIFPSLKLFFFFKTHIQFFFFGRRDGGVGPLRGEGGKTTPEPLKKNHKKEKIDLEAVN